MFFPINMIAQIITGLFGHGPSSFFSNSLEEVSKESTMKMTRFEKKFVNAGKHGRKNLEILQRLFTQLDTGTIKKVLEIGCGVGTVAAFLNDKHGMSVVAIDADPEQVDIADSRYKDLENLVFRQADATVLPFEDTEFDLVLSMNVFHHISDWGRGLSEVSRVLKPEGFFIFHDFAYSKLIKMVFRPIARNYGIYTIGDIIEGAKIRGLKIIYEEKPTGLLFSGYSLIFQKR